MNQLSLSAEKNERVLNVSDCAKQIPLRDEICVRELCPYGESIRMDAVTFNRYDRKIRGFEIKLTRADFLQDKKWERYLPYCNYFSFVAPKGVIQKEELPDKIGLIEVFFAEKLWATEEVRITSEIVKKMYRLHDVPAELYIKLLEGIALKAAVQRHNII